VYGDKGEPVIKEHEMGRMNGHAHAHATGMRTPVGEKDVRLG
jgi:hypothetical protein